MIPKAKHVVISSRRKSRTIWRPLHSADLSFVSLEGGSLVLADTHIMVDDRVVTRSTGEDVFVPRYSKACPDYKKRK